MLGASTVASSQTGVGSQQRLRGEKKSVSVYIKKTLVHHRISGDCRTDERREENRTKGSQLERKHTMLWASPSWGNVGRKKMYQKDISVTNSKVGQNTGSEGKGKKPTTETIW